MKLNWHIVAFDILVVTWIGLAVYTWTDSTDERKFRDVVMGILLVIWRVEAHYSFYKKEKRFY